ncbi:MAG: VCBS repeat-containing protein, partial [Acidobacteria bacterium]|nr:VCBS repeat-containing protein [Acidobacteriota bacterium]
MIRSALALSALLLCSTVSFALPQKAVFDFDGDNRTDYAVARGIGATYTWYIQRSTAGFLAQDWGTPSTDLLVPGDYDGDGKWDIAVWRNSNATFYILQSLTGTLRVVPFGVSGDDPRISQDFDGDGKTDPAVARTTSGGVSWLLLRSMLGPTVITFGLGQSIDTAI